MVAMDRCSGFELIKLFRTSGCSPLAYDENEEGEEVQT